MNLTWSISALKLYGSYIASSLSILRLMWMFWLCRPWMSLEYGTCSKAPRLASSVLLSRAA